MHAVTDTISLREVTFFDTLAQMKKINAGQKKCKNSITGCGWIGDPSEVESHLKSCDYVLQNCTNIGCNFKVLRKDMTEHTRRVCDFRSRLCEYCNSNVKHDQLSRHQKECEYVMIPCEEGCKKSIMRSKMAHHLQKECTIKLITEVECPKKAVDASLPGNFGPTVAKIHDNHNQHVYNCLKKQENELAAMKQELKSLKTEVDITKEAMQAVRTVLFQELHNLHSPTNPKESSSLESIHTQLYGEVIYLSPGGEPATFRMTNYEQLKSTSGVWYTSPFYIAQGYKFCFGITFRVKGPSPHLSLSLHQIKAESDEYLTWPFNFEGILGIDLVQQTVPEKRHKSKATHEEHSSTVNYKQENEFVKQSHVELTIHQNLQQPMSSGTGEPVIQIEDLCPLSVANNAVYDDSLILQCQLEPLSKQTKGHGAHSRLRKEAIQSDKDNSDDLHTSSGVATANKSKGEQHMHILNGSPALNLMFFSACFFFVLYFLAY